MSLKKTLDEIEDEFRREKILEELESRKREEQEKNVEAEQEKRVIEGKEKEISDILNDSDSELDEPHVYGVRFESSAVREYYAHGQYYNYGGMGSSYEHVNIEEFEGTCISTRRIVATKREIMLMTALNKIENLKNIPREKGGGFYSVADVTENNTFIFPSDPYNGHCSGKYCQDIAATREPKFYDIIVETDITKEEAEKLELARKKVEYIRNLDSKEAMKKAKMKGYQVDITDAQAALCSINVNQELFEFSEDILRQEHPVRFTLLQIKNALSRHIERGE